jgi:putative aldouronate transport system substrate-binding protein
MKTLLKILSVTVLLVFTTGALLAAGAVEETTAEERLVITMIPWTSQGTTLAPDSWVELYIEELYNVDLQPWYDIDSYDAEARSVRIAGGDIPDFLSVWGGHYTEWITMGAVRKLSKGLIMEHMPNYMKWTDEYLGDAKWNDTVFDGINYRIPGVFSGASVGMAMGIRGDWMRAVGYEPEPVPGKDFLRGPDSLEELEDLFLKFRNDDPDGNGKKDTYGYMAWKNSPNFEDSVLPNVVGAFGIRRETWDVRDGKGYYSMVDPNYRDALKYLNRWWELEIIHPDTVAFIRPDILRAMANDEFGAFSDWDGWHITRTGGPWGAYFENHPDGDIAIVITPEGPTGGRGTHFRPAAASKFAFGINASDEVVIKVMQMLEDINLDADKYASIGYGGEEGETWKKIDGGYRIAIPGTGSQKDATTATQLGIRLLTFGSSIVPPIDKAYFAPERHALISYLGENQTKREGVLGIKPSWTEDESALASNVDSVEQEFAWKAITGGIDIDAEWDGYVQAMMDAGLDKLLAALLTK